MTLLTLSQFISSSTCRESVMFTVVPGLIPSCEYYPRSVRFEHFVSRADVARVCAHKQRLAAVVVAVTLHTWPSDPTFTPVARLRVRMVGQSTLMEQSRRGLQLVPVPQGLHWLSHTPVTRPGLARMLNCRPTRQEARSRHVPVL